MKSSSTEKNSSEKTIRSIMKESSENISRPSSALFDKIEQTIASTDQRIITPPSSKASYFSTFFQFIQSFSTRPQLAWGVAAVQTIAICLLISFSGKDKQYQTLSINQEAPDAAAAYYHVIFHNAARADDIQTLLSENHVTISNGPGKQNIYTLKVRENMDTKTVLQKLKKSAVITFLEPAH